MHNSATVGGYKEYLNSKGGATASYDTLRRLFWTVLVDN